jgi:hypothetical protein
MPTCTSFYVNFNFIEENTYPYIILHVVQTAYGAYSASYPMGTEGSFPGGRAARA